MQLAANSPSRVTGRVRFPNSPGTSYLYRTTALNPGNNNFHILGWLNWHATDQFGDLEIIVNYSDHYTVATMRFWYNTSAGRVAAVFQASTKDGRKVLGSCLICISTPLPIKVVLR